MNSKVILYHDPYYSVKLLTHIRGSVICTNDEWTFEFPLREEFYMSVSIVLLKEQKQFLSNLALKLFNVYSLPNTDMTTVSEPNNAIPTGIN